jgi:dUTP pyrophosphatase
MTNEVRLTKTDPEATLPTRATAGSFGYDLATIEATTIGPHETTIIKTGMKLSGDLPCKDEDGVAMLILPRSSLPLKYGLILPNSPGLIDADYGGDIGVIVHNLKEEPVTLEPGTRIAQAVFAKLWLPTIAEGSDDSPRPRGGFGSTGS